jgi:protein TonB
MKLSSTIFAAGLLLGSLASVAQQPAPALTGDAKPDSGIMNADVYTNQFFGFSYRVPSQWTGKAIQRSQPGQRFYQLLSALPAASAASIQYMGIQAEDITAPVVKTASQFIQSSPLAGKNSAYEMLGPVREMEIGGHHFARADYKTKPSADDAGLTMYQTQLVTVLHNHAVTLSFTSDSQPALDQLAASASSIIFLSAPAAAPIPAAPAPQPVVTAPAIAVATPPPAPAKPKIAPEVTNGTVVMTFSDDPAPSKATMQAAAPEVQMPAPEPAKAEPAAVQTTAQPVTFNPKPEPKVETVAATAPAKSKPSAGIPINNILASNPEPVTVAKNDPPVLSAAAPVTTTTQTSTPVTSAPEPAASAAPSGTAAAEVVSDATPANTVAVSGITRVSDTRMRLSEEALKEYIFSKSPMVYPQLAKQMNVQGNVVMQVVITIEGKVKEVKVVSGAPQLQGTAVDSLRNWRFLPYLDNGRPMEVESQVTIGFKLSGR